MPHKNWRFGSLSSSTPLRNDPDSPSSPCSPLYPIRPRPTASSHLTPRPRATAKLHSHSLLSSSVYTPPSPPTTHSTTSPTIPTSLPSPSSSSDTETSATSASSTDSDHIPDSPQYWLWRCHLCSRRYNLGTTRRCLENGHYFCARPLEEQKERRGRRRKGDMRGCESEFDYRGWAAWGVWRRGLGLNLNGCEEMEVEVDGGEIGRDCWNNCKYPSECLNKMQERAAQAAREKMAREEEREWNTLVCGDEAEVEVVELGFGLDLDFGVEGRLGSVGSVGWDDDAGEVLGMQVFSPFENEVTVEFGNERTAFDSFDSGDINLGLEIYEGETEAGPLGIDPSRGLSEETESTFLQVCKNRMDGDGSGKRPSSPLKSSFGFDGECGKDMETTGDVEDIFF